MVVDSGFMPLATLGAYALAAGATRKGSGMPWACVTPLKGIYQGGPRRNLSVLVEITRVA